MELGSVDFAVCRGFHVDIRGGRSFDMPMAEDMLLLDVVGVCSCMSEYLLFDVEGEDFVTTYTSTEVNDEGFVTFTIKFLGRPKAIHDFVKEHVIAGLVIKKLGLA